MSHVAPTSYTRQVNAIPVDDPHDVGRAALYSDAVLAQTIGCNIAVRDRQILTVLINDTPLPNWHPTRYPISSRAT
jgi:hypothetical protein